MDPSTPPSFGMCKVINSETRMKISISKQGFPGLYEQVKGESLGRGAWWLSLMGPEWKNHG